ncbi:type II toxin-antitoxin system prevent-host-death family antitoxin [Caballeronia sp. LZ043]|uniref:type II toxin-antitoxin system Phd/YefM family antitoxin n=1 Tax=Caballeronia sp. LZ043 TaxID=3038569 RepID=UPI002854DE1C|nr:type II toxin-antitoxin system prevent-host-death family antitoxin [Caballeronia sp. LZ043]MDR5826062.1 type II toxin-antitoxin system prevent-host-death family antitoxin [Caballeronia sp. LZ043]
MQTVNIHEAKSQLSRLIEAAVGGEEVVIAKAGTPVVRLVAVERSPKLRLGLMKGKIKIASDFNAPLPEDILATFEGR